MLKEEARAPLPFYVKRTSTDQLKTSPVPTISLPKSKTQQRKPYRQHELKKEALTFLRASHHLQKVDTIPKEQNQQHIP